MKKIEHIGIAVSNLEDANKLYAKLLDSKSYKTEMVDLEGGSWTIQVPRRKTDA